VVYNFIDPDRHEREVPPCIPPCTCSEQVTLMHISNFRPVKRIRDVIRIFAKVAKEMDARLILVGDGPEAPVAEQIATELDVLDRVTFVGVVDRVAPLLEAADLFLLPSATESFGLAALEAMASGVPVIASDVGGLPEVVEHETNGYLAPVGDVDQMATYAIELLSDYPRRKAFANAARKRAATVFDHRKIVPQYEAIYEQILSE